MRLGINIDHVATIRNARGGVHPDPVRAALIAEKAGADSITVHLREDRRHIRDEDVFAIRSQIAIPLNFEMAATEEMVAIACRLKPYACCIVPEKRAELTTEGGLNVSDQLAHLTQVVHRLKQAKILVSLFVDADKSQIDAAKQSGATRIEIHTGRYCELAGEAQSHALDAIHQTAEYAASIGLECHAGHGLNYDNVGPIAAIHEIIELNIGHFLMGEAMMIGLEEAIRTMRHKINKARHG